MGVTTHPRLTPRFIAALDLARELHAEQPRKGTSIPYLAHLLAVAALVLEQGGDETEAIAGVLHDAVEDQGGPSTLLRIREGFDEEVADIVAACSDTDEDPKPPWRARKEQYLAHLRTAPEPVLRVSLADKLHNAQAILFDHRQSGDELWSRFRAGPDQQLWYYGSLADVFIERLPGPHAQELRRVVDKLAARLRLSEDENSEPVQQA